MATLQGTGRCPGRIHEGSNGMRRWAFSRGALYWRCADLRITQRLRPGSFEDNNVDLTEESKTAVSGSQSQLGTGGSNSRHDSIEPLAMQAAEAPNAARMDDGNQDARKLTQNFIKETMNFPAETLCQSQKRKVRRLRTTDPFSPTRTPPPSVTPSNLPQGSLRTGNQQS